MVINRVDLLRVIKIIKSVGKDEIRLDDKGYFGTAYPDGCGLLFGKGISFGRPVAFLDLDKLQKILDSFTQMEINVEIADGMLFIVGGDVKYGYRLADWDMVEGFDQDILPQQQDGWEWCHASFRYEDLNRMRKLIRAMGAGKVSFKEEDGKLLVCVGDKKMYFGEIKLDKIGLVSEAPFEAAKVDEIINVLDEGRVGFSFGLRKGFDENIKQEYTEFLLKVVNSDFTWLVGSLKSE